MSNAVSEELVEKARDAYDDAAGSMTEWCEIEYMRAALTAIAPRLRAEGMREAADIVEAGHIAHHSPINTYTGCGAILARADVLKNRGEV